MEFKHEPVLLEAAVSGLAIRPDGTLQFIRPGETHASTLLNQGVRDTFSFGPLLVENGKRVYQDYTDKVYTMRVVLGYSDPYHFLAVVAMRDRPIQMTHIMMADACVRYGCRIPEMAWNIQEKVKREIAGRTEAAISKINIHVQGVSFDEQL